MPNLLRFIQKIMLPALGIALGIAADLAVLLAIGFLLGKIMPRISNFGIRFVLLFALCVPLNFLINDINVRLRGYHKIGWTEASLIALLLAAYGTFRWPPPNTSSAS